MKLKYISIFLVIFYAIQVVSAQASCDCNHYFWECKYKYQTGGPPGFAVCDCTAQCLSKGNVCKNDYCVAPGCVDKTCANFPGYSYNGDVPLMDGCGNKLECINNCNIGEKVFSDYKCRDENYWTCSDIDNVGGTSPTIVNDASNKHHVVHYDFIAGKVRYCNDISGTFTCKNILDGRLQDDYYSQAPKNLAIKKGRLADSNSYSDTLHGIFLKNNKKMTYVKLNFNGIIQQETEIEGPITIFDDPNNIVGFDNLGTRPSIALDSQGFVHIAYYNGVKMRYCNNKLGPFNCISGDFRGDVMIDSNDNVRVGLCRLVGNVFDCSDTLKLPLGIIVVSTAIDTKNKLHFVGIYVSGTGIFYGNESLAPTGKYSIVDIIQEEAPMGFSMTIDKNDIIHFAVGLWYLNNGDAFYCNSKSGTNSPVFMEYTPNPLFTRGAPIEALAPEKLKSFECHHIQTKTQARFEGTFYKSMIIDALNQFNIAFLGDDGFKFCNALPINGGGGGPAEICNNGIDDDSDGLIDGNTFLNLSNGQTQVFGGNYHLWTVVRDILSANIVSKGFSYSLPGIRAIYRGDGPWETPLLHQPTLVKYCNILGYRTYTGNTFCHSTEGCCPLFRCNFNTPQNNEMFMFNPNVNNFVAITAAPKYQRSWLTGITCIDRLPECSDYWDNDNDGNIDYPLDPGCVSPDDNNEIDYDPECFWENCTNNIDDDFDGDIDNADPDCPNEICNNSIDDDFDTLIDCNDTDCLCFWETPASEDFKVTGGLISLSYYNPDVNNPNDNKIKKPITGIEGIINSYDGMNIPEDASKIKMHLEYQSDEDIFVNLNSREIYSGNSMGSGRKTVDLEINDINEFKGKDIGIRIGTIGVDYLNQDLDPGNDIMSERFKEFQHNDPTTNPNWEIIPVNDAIFETNSENSLKFQENSFELVKSKNNNHPKVIAKMKHVKLSEFKEWELEFRVRFSQGCGDMFKLDLYNGYSIEFDLYKNPHDSNTGIGLTRNGEANHIQEYDINLCADSGNKLIKINFNKGLLTVDYEGTIVINQKLEGLDPNSDIFQFVAYYQNDKATMQIRDIVFKAMDKDKMAYLYPESYFEVTRANINPDISSKFIENINIGDYFQDNVDKINLIVNSGLNWVSKIILTNGNGVIHTIYQIDPLDPINLGEPSTYTIDRNLLTSSGNVLTFESIDKDKIIQGVSGDINAIVDFTDNSVVIYSACDSGNYCGKSNGCDWHFKDNLGQEFIQTIPPLIDGEIYNRDCYYQTGVFDILNSVDNSFYRVLREIDIDDDGDIDEPFSIDNLNIETVYEPLPTEQTVELQIRRWY